MRGPCIVNGTQETFTTCWHLVMNFSSLKASYCYKKFNYKALCYHAPICIDLYRCKNNLKSALLT